MTIERGVTADMLGELMNLYISMSLGEEDDSLDGWTTILFCMESPAFWTVSNLPFCELKHERQKRN